MYCNNCGNQLKDNQRFCSKCGKENIVPETLICNKCGALLDTATKFCSNCGAAVIEKSKEEPVCCQKCGYELKEDEQFCPQCGSPKKISKPNNFNQTLFNLASKSFRKKDSSDILLDESYSLKIKHFVLAGIFLMILIFEFIPTFRINIPVASLLNSSYETFRISVGNPLGNDSLINALALTGDTDIAYIQLYSGICTFLKFLCFALVIFATVRPIFKKTLAKKRRLILQFCVAISSFLEIIYYWMLINSAIQETNSTFSSAVAYMNITFWGILLMLLTISAIIVSIMIVRNNSQAYKGSPSLLSNIRTNIIRKNW